MKGRRSNLIGCKFGRLTVISSHVQRDKNNKRQWNCLCDCGNYKLARGNDLVTGGVKSCGCLHHDFLTQGQIKHGYSKEGKKSKEYLIWVGMRQRCNNKNSTSFKYYGGRGIKVCERWSKFENFIADMGPCQKDYSIDRINNNGDYEPSNCRWATIEEQLLNRRPTNYKGIKNPRAKFTVEQIKLIRNDKRSQPTIARDFGTSQTNISAIKLRRTWANV